MAPPARPRLSRPAAVDPRPQPAGRGRRRLGAAIRAALTVAACAAATVPGVAAAASPQQAGSGSADPVAVNLYRVAARARAALDLLRGGDPAAASTQLDEADQGPLAQLGPARGELAAALRRLRQALAAGDTRAARNAEVAVGDAARQAAAKRQGAGGAPLVAALVRDAGDEAQEAAAATGAQATEPHAYALALTEVAGQLARAGGLPASGRDAVSALAAAIRGRSDAATVAAGESAALAALGAPPSAQDVGRAFDAIDRDLDQAVARYRQADADGALDDLIGAYLNEFEGLEPALRRVDADLEERLEATLAHGLRGLVRDRVSVTRFAAAVGQARADLQTARGALE